MEAKQFIQLAWHVLTGSTSPRQSAAVLALSTITTEAINREPQQVATGATAALTATDHSTAYPGGGASKKKHGSRKPNVATSAIGQVPRQPGEATEITKDSSRLRRELHRRRCSTRGVFGLSPPTQERRRVIAS